MTTNAFKRPLAIFTVLGGLLIAAAPASALERPGNTHLSGGGEGTTDGSLPGSFRADHRGVGEDGSSSRGDADNFKAVVVLIGANDYGFADIPSRSPE